MVCLDICKGIISSGDILSKIYFRARNEIKGSNNRTHD